MHEKNLRFPLIISLFHVCSISLPRSFTLFYMGVVAGLPGLFTIYILLCFEIRHGAIVLTLCFVFYRSESVPLNVRKLLVDTYKQAADHLLPTFLPTRAFQPYRQHQKYQYLLLTVMKLLIRHMWQLFSKLWILCNTFIDYGAFVPLMWRHLDRFIHDAPIRPFTSRDPFIFAEAFIM